MKTEITAQIQFVGMTDGKPTMKVTLNPFGSSPQTVFVLMEVGNTINVNNMVAESDEIIELADKAKQQAIEVIAKAKDGKDS